MVDYPANDWDMGEFAANQRGGKMERINSLTHKIEAIKALRTFTLDTFGICAGLKESKDFVDYLCEELGRDDEIKAFIAKHGEGRVRKVLGIGY